MLSTSKDKMLVEKRIFRNSRNTPFMWQDIKHLDLQDSDIISCEWVEPFYSENNSWDGHYSCEIIRMVEETDEQQQKRLERNKRNGEEMKERRRETYLRLKKEFES